MLNLYQTIQRLKNPHVRLDDNSDYCLDDEVIGELVAYHTSTVRGTTSPGNMLSRDVSLDRRVLDGFKGNFQRSLREFLTDRLGELSLREKTSDNFKGEYVPKAIPFDREYDFNSVEGRILTLSDSARFTEIGQIVETGAQIYHNLAQRKGMMNFKYAAEYDAIFEELKK